jgi:hypothetical protein
MRVGGPFGDCSRGSGVRRSISGRFASFFEHFEPFLGHHDRAVPASSSFPSLVGLRQSLSRVEDVGLKRRIRAALFPAGDARLLQVEVALDAPARFIGDLAFSQQPEDVFALGGDQFRP